MADDSLIQTNVISTVKLTKVQVLYNHNQVMTEGYGNTRKQAERNASINGLNWLKKNRLIEDGAAASSGMGVHHNPITGVPLAFDARKIIRDDDTKYAGDIEMTNENQSDEEEKQF